MGYAIELYFDHTAERMLNAIWQRLVKNHIAGMEFYLNNRPHLSLAVYHGSLERDKFLKKFREYRMKGIRLTLANPGFFCTEENIVFVSPRTTGGLIDIHRKFHEDFGEFREDESKLYLPENWIPHVTMAVGLKKSKFIKALKFLKKEFKPLDAEIESAGLIKFKPIEYLLIKELSKG